MVFFSKWRIVGKKSRKGHQNGLRECNFHPSHSCFCPKGRASSSLRSQCELLCDVASPSFSVFPNHISLPCSQSRLVWPASLSDEIASSGAWTSYSAVLHGLHWGEKTSFCIVAVFAGTKTPALAFLVLENRRNPVTDRATRHAMTFLFSPGLVLFSFVCY